MVHLKVIHAPPEDVGKRIVRVAPIIMKKFNFFENEVIEIISERKRTPAILKSLTLPQEDVASEEDDLEWDETKIEGFITMDGLVRSSIECSLNSVVRIDKTTIKRAKKVVLQPLRKLTHPVTKEHFQQLVGIPASVLDILELHFYNVPEIEPSPDGAGKINVTPMDSECRFLVTEVAPLGMVQIYPETEFVIKEYNPELIRQDLGTLTYEDFGGYWREKKRLHELIELPLRNPNFFKPINISFPKGVLISGASGVGKSLLARTVASESKVNTVKIDVANILTTDLSESERHLKRYFREAKVRSPSIILIDDIDLIASTRDTMTTSEITRRITTLLLQEIDRIAEDDAILIIGTTSRPDTIDPSFRRPGRIDIEINMNAPNRNDREEILIVLTRGIPTDADVNFQELAQRTRGYNGADLTMLVKQASLQAFRRILPSVDLREHLPTNLLAALSLNQSDFEDALRLVEPSAMREIFVDIPDTKWEDVGGLEQAKQELREAVEWPVKHPEVFREMGVSPPSGILLFGPPGTGKTLLAKAVANESQSNFIPVRGPELASKWFGETEKAIRDVFRKAKSLAPSIIFFDEVDSLMRARGSTEESHVDRIINQFLTELDGIDKRGRILVIGATNRPELLDPAVLRPGRFDRLIYIPTPDQEGRKKILEVHTKGMPLGDDVDLDELAKKTNFYVGADLENLCREAAMIALRENFTKRSVEWRHFEEALKHTGPTMNPELVRAFNNLANNLRGKVTSLGRRNLDSYL